MASESSTNPFRRMGKYVEHPRIVYAVTVGETVTAALTVRRRMMDPSHEKLWQTTVLATAQPSSFSLDEHNFQ